MHGHLDARHVIACHDELVVECPEEQAEEVARFLEGVMVDGMGKVLNPGLDADHSVRFPERSPVITTRLSALTTRTRPDL